jgi:hypothetical protein
MFVWLAFELVKTCLFVWLSSLSRHACLVGFRACQDMFVWLAFELVNTWPATRAHMGQATLSKGLMCQLAQERSKSFALCSLITCDEAIPKPMQLLKRPVAANLPPSL